MSNKTTYLNFIEKNVILILPSSYLKNKNIHLPENLQWCEPQTDN